MNLDITLKYKTFLNFEKAAFDALVFHHAFQIGCVYISNCGLNRRLKHIKYSIQEMYDYDRSKLMICSIIDNIIGIST